MLSYDIETGSTVGRDIPGPGCVILKWGIRLTPELDLDPPLPPVFTFELSSKSTR